MEVKFYFCLTQTRPPWHWPDDQSSAIFRKLLRVSDLSGRPVNRNLKKLLRIMNKIVSDLPRLLLLALFALLPLNRLNAQLSLKPGSLVEVSNSTEFLLHRSTPEARMEITDDNGRVCALLKLNFEYVTKCDRDLLAKPGSLECDLATFVTKIEQKDDGQLWLFLTPGATYLYLKHPEAGRVGLEFRKLGVDLKSQTVYEATIQGDKEWFYKRLDNCANQFYFVDLGLPSGLKWGTCNVGAGNPDEYGHYYAWGETRPKNTYDWGNYRWCDGDYNKLTKYNNIRRCGKVDGKDVLEPSDDAARANWGGHWRMPTHEEWQELCDQCDWQRTTQGDTQGYLVTSRSNGNSLFLPAAGACYETSLFGAGLGSAYWSSSVDTDAPYGVWTLYADTAEVNPSSFSYRCNGYSVRPVCE